MLPVLFLAILLRVSVVAGSWRDGPVVKAPAILAEDLDSIPRIHIQLPTTYNSSSRRFALSSDLHGTAYM